jgi:antitoxin component HigA of HigAB toxin-antitoxin module
MEPRIIKTDEQYRQFRAEVERLAVLDPEPESHDGLRLELFSKLVEDYEKSRFTFATPDPIDAIIFRMEQQGLRQKDIAPLLGGKNRASEVLSRRRRLTKAMISALYEKLHIPLELLVREPGAVYSTDRATSTTRKFMSSSRPDEASSHLLRGFEGFLPLETVRSSLLQIPADFGIYAIVWPDRTVPEFIEKSRAGRFKDSDPSYSLDVLRKKWVPTATVLYVGKAGPTAGRTLRKRILELVRFGSGDPVAHRGGRALWQVEGIWRAQIAWKAAAQDPLGAEQAMLAKFERAFGRLPYANFRR